MRPKRLLGIAAAGLFAASAAHAQIGMEGGWRDEGPRRPHHPTHADSTRSLAGAWQLWGHLGIDWMGSPSEVKSRYNPGFGFGVSGDRRFADRVALRARLGYHDLPSKQASLNYVNNAVYGLGVSYGHGYLASGLGGAAVRTWNHLWLEGDGGGGYFKSGLPSGQTYVDPVSGQTIRLPTGSGWGGVWGLGVRYEFQPTMRDRILAECQYLSMDRGGTTLGVWMIRVGYRAL